MLMFISWYAVVLAGDLRIVLILIAVIWFIANLLKKASEASRRATGERPKPPGQQPERETQPAPRVGSLSDFFRRLKEMSEEEGKPVVPPRAEAEQADRRAFGPTPPLRKPTLPKEGVSRRVPVGEPSLKPAERREKPPEREVAAMLRMPVGEPFEDKSSLAPAAVAVAPKTPETDAYVIKAAGPARVAKVLGTAISASELKKGIVLAEILGRPKALRRQRRLIRR